MRKKIKISRIQIFFLLFLISLFVLITPHIVRLFNHDPALIGDEPYYHARIARQTAETGGFTEDNFVHGSRQYNFDPYHSILALFSMIFGVVLASIIVPFCCGMLSVWLFYLILKKLKFNKLNRIAISLVFILSPVFIYIFSLSTPFCIIVFLDLLGFYLFLKKEKDDFMLSVLVFSLSAFFSLANLFFVVILALAYVIYNKKSMKKFFSLLLFMSLVFLIHYVNIYFNFGITYDFDIFHISLIQRFVTDLGGLFGFSVFTLLLSILGLAMIWNEKSRFYHVYLIMLFVLIVSFFYNYAVVYSNFVVSILAGMAFAALIKRKWELKFVRNLSIILLFCGILFSAVSYTVRISEDQPNSELMDALDWIKHNSDEGDVVFSHYTKGFWIQFMTERPVLIDSISKESSLFAEIIEDSEIIFESWDIKETRDLLQKYNTSYILITNDMADGLVWEKQEQGLAYLLRNSETFNKEYSNTHVGVWRYIYSEND